MTDATERLIQQCEREAEEMQAWWATRPHARLVQRCASELLHLDRRCNEMAAELSDARLRHARVIETQQYIVMLAFPEEPQS